MEEQMEGADMAKWSTGEWKSSMVGDTGFAFDFSGSAAPPPVASFAEGSDDSDEDDLASVSSVSSAAPEPALRSEVQAITGDVPLEALLTSSDLLKIAEGFCRDNATMHSEWRAKKGLWRDLYQRQRRTAKGRIRKGDGKEA
eukprot:Sspe_Gene.90253::Locus_61838_Transcript_1_1_Confidence_1.000_Length_492::g.90253::m.90253